IPTLVTMTLASGFQLARLNGMLSTSYGRHGWVVASFAVVGVMAVVAIGLLEPANVAVLFELRKPQPNGAVIEKLMRRFIYTAGSLLALLTLLLTTFTLNVPILLAFTVARFQDPGSRDRAAEAAAGGSARA